MTARNERDGYLRELGRALTAAGIHGRHRQRILDEFSDHLDCDPVAQLGAPGSLAAQFADELGTERARSAAFRAFTALAVTGLLLAVRLLSMGSLNPVGGSPPDGLGLFAAVLAAQISFVTGGLALLRGWRLRRDTTIVAAEARILSRRAGVALAAGVLATLAIPLRAASTPGHPSASAPLSLAAVAAALLVLILAVPSLVRAVRLRPQTGGPAGDLFADLGPFGALARTVAGGSVNRFAAMLGAALFAAGALQGVVANDPYDGLIRAALESGACLGTYLSLGRYLGLRQERVSAQPS